MMDLSAASLVKRCLAVFPFSHAFQLSKQDMRNIAFVKTLMSSAQEPREKWPRFRFDDDALSFSDGSWKGFMILRGSGKCSEVKEQHVVLFPSDRFFISLLLKKIVESIFHSENYD